MEDNAIDPRAALEAAWEQDNSSESPAPEQAESQEAVAASEVETGATGGEQPEGLFYDVDPNSLTPELRQMFDGMQKAFTEKNQSLAAERKLIESFGGLDQAQEAYNFVSGLQDPNALVQLHSELSEYLQESGLTKAEADAEASRQVQAASESDDEEDYGFSDPRDDELRNEIEELRAWREQMEEERQQAQIELDLQRQEQAIREANPSYSDDDITTIYRMSYSFGGDLDAAQGAFEAERQRIISSYVNSKETAPSGTAPPPVAGAGQEADSFGTDFEAAHKYAKQRLQALQNMGELS